MKNNSNTTALETVAINYNLIYNEGLLTQQEKEMFKIGRAHV